VEKNIDKIYEVRDHVNRIISKLKEEKEKENFIPDYPNNLYF